MTPLEKLKALLVSRRFIAAAVALVIVMSNHYGLQLDTEQLLGVVVTFVGWIVGDSIQKTGTTPTGSLPEVVVTEARQRVKARGESFSGRPM